MGVGAAPHSYLPVTADLPVISTGHVTSKICEGKVIIPSQWLQLFIEAS